MAPCFHGPNVLTRSATAPTAISRRGRSPTRARSDRRESDERNRRAGCRRGEQIVAQGDDDGDQRRERQDHRDPLRARDHGGHRARGHRYREARIRLPGVVVEEDRATSGTSRRRPPQPPPHAPPLQRVLQKTSPQDHLSGRSSSPRASCMACKDFFQPSRPQPRCSSSPPPPPPSPRFRRAPRSPASTSRTSARAPRAPLWRARSSRSGRRRSRSRAAAARRCRSSPPTRASSSATA